MDNSNSTDFNDSVDSNPSDSTCFDTPGWTTESIFNPGESFGCDALEVSCLSIAKYDCCKCKEECCGKCANSQWDTITCGLRTLPPALAPVSRPSSPLTDQTSCLCSRYAKKRTYNGKYVQVRETYSKSCPKELFPNWPDDCDACCSYVSPESQKALFGLFGLVALIFVGVLVHRARRNRGDKAAVVEVPDAPVVIGDAYETGVINPTIPARNNNEQVVPDGNNIMATSGPEIPVAVAIPM